MSTADEGPKDLVLLHGEIKSPPFTRAARVEVGTLLRRLQDGQTIGMPLSRPMPSIGPRCHELRVRDEDNSWRVIYRIDPRTIVIAEIFSKTTRQTPKHIIDVCQSRLARYDEAVAGAAKKRR
jgi:phage-related protein